MENKIWMVTNTGIVLLLALLIVSIAKMAFQG